MVWRWTAWPAMMCGRSIGMLAQDAHIFDTTIEENLRLARPGRDRRGASVSAGGSRAAGLGGRPPARSGDPGRRPRCTDCPGGSGSGSALARILLAGHRVVVLDEPTEHLDPVEGERVLAGRLAALEGRAVILITHHLPDVMDCDEVLVLQRGRQAQVGPPGRLAREQGPFADMLLTGRRGA